MFLKTARAHVNSVGDIVTVHAPKVPKPPIYADERPDNTVRIAMRDVATTIAVMPAAEDENNGFP